jgi:hypothetical protein
MRTEQLIGIGLFTMALVFTVYTWFDRLAGRKYETKLEEGFSTDIISKATLDMISKANAPVPTEMDAENAYQTLLQFMRHDLSKGIYYANDFAQRVFVPGTKVRDDLDVQKLLHNYRSPLQRI